MGLKPKLQILMGYEHHILSLWHKVTVFFAGQCTSYIVPVYVPYLPPVEVQMPLAQNTDTLAVCWGVGTSNPKALSLNAVKANDIVSYSQSVGVCLSRGELNVACL